MTGHARARRPSEPQTATLAPTRRYHITIGGIHQRTINGDAAETTFRRGSQSPDVVMYGDLLTGFYWEWPNNTRLMIVPVPDSVADPVQTECGTQAVTP